MRLVYTTQDAEKGRTLANFLSSEKIDNQLEMVKNTNWGDGGYGETTFKIWVYDEDLAEIAEKWIQVFEQDPKNSQFQKTGYTTTVIPSVLSGNEESNIKGPRPQMIDLLKARNPSNYRDSNLKLGSTKTVTMGLILLCCLFYLISTLTTPQVLNVPQNLPTTPLVSAPIKKQFLYDYPYAYQLTDKLVKLYGIDKLQIPEELPPEGQFIYKEIQKTPYWTGYYNQVLDDIQQGKQPAKAPLFEKIKQGEVWRLFTPCIMHSDLLHILFNMLWLLILGKQLEERLNPRRYILMILIIGIFSNTCQYLMSGPNFLGFSGVICGMVAFIWVRQKIAPWEGYPLDKGTSLFILYFISALLAIQVVSFYMETYHHISFSPGIANTAHITGAAMGVLLGFLPFFKKSSKIARPTK